MFVASCWAALSNIVYLDESYLFQYNCYYSSKVDAYITDIIAQKMMLI